MNNISNVVNIERVLDNINYKDINNLPLHHSDFAFNMVNFRNAITAYKPLKNKTPAIHYLMFDAITKPNNRIAFLLSRGLGKTQMIRDLILYVAAFHKIEGFSEINVMLFVGAAMMGNTNQLLKDLKEIYNNSPALREYIPTPPNFTEREVTFINWQGKKSVLALRAAGTNFRGITALGGQRPELVIIDDLLSDEQARSDRQLQNIHTTIQASVEPSVDPNNYKILYAGTPFGKSDPLYSYIESGVYLPIIFPACEKFPCTKEDFESAWPDRFTYEFINEKYQMAKKTGRENIFYQEYMLQISSEEDRLIPDSYISYYDTNDIKDIISKYTYYITTDFATSEKESADLSVISVWAYTENEEWLLVDGIAKRQKMNNNIDDLFRLCSLYSPLAVGIETSGQQGAFIDWLYKEMNYRDQYFNILRYKNQLGIRPTKDKLSRFNVIVPLFFQHKIKFPKDKLNLSVVSNGIKQLKLATVNGFVGHDDVLDTISMLQYITPVKPTIIRTNYFTSTQELNKNMYNNFNNDFYNDLHTTEQVSTDKLESFII